MLARERVENEKSHKFDELQEFSVWDAKDSLDDFFVSMKNSPMLLQTCTKHITAMSDYIQIDNPN